MRSMSRRHKKHISCFLAVYITLILSLLPARENSIAAENQENLVLIELSQKRIDSDWAKAYYISLKNHLKERLQLNPLSFTAHKLKESGKVELESISSHTLYLWEEKLNEGKQLINNLELKRGLSILEELIDAPYRYNLEGAAREIVEEALLASALVLYKSKKEEKSRSLIKRYLSISAMKDLSDVSYPPDFMNFYRSIKEEPLYVTIALNSTPRGAKVFINDLFQGLTPYYSKYRVWGKAKISIQKDGFIDQVFYKTVFPGDRVSIDTHLTIDDVGLIQRSVDRGSYEEAGFSLGKLLTRTRFPYGLVVILYDDEKGRHVDYVFKEKAEEGEVGTQVTVRGTDIGVEFQEKDLYPLIEEPLFSELLPANVRSGIDNRAVKKGKITDRWWFWTIVGIGAAGVAYGILKGGDQSKGAVTVEF